MGRSSASAAARPDHPGDRDGAGLRIAQLVPGDAIMAAMVQHYMNDPAVARVRHQFGLDQPILVQWRLAGAFLGRLGRRSRARRSMPCSCSGCRSRWSCSALRVVGRDQRPAGMVGAPAQFRGRCRVSAAIGRLIEFLGGDHADYLWACFHRPPSGLRAVRRSAAQFRSMLRADLRARHAFGHIGALRAPSLLEVLGQDYIRTARAKGFSERASCYCAEARDDPVVTVIGPGMGRYAGRRLFVEVIFAIPGSAG
jgi:hypothetical protein